MEKALIAAGCFWGIEEFFQKINGVKKTTVGYSGGHVHDPNYEDVCTGSTGHAEVALIEFDEDQLSYKKIIDYFWKCHDPTQLNKQGPDIGTQYRSAIYYYSELQKTIAENSKDDFQKLISKPIVTEITKAKEFFPAEEYHQCFIRKKFYNE